MIPRLLAGLVAGSIALLASASPAFAWHVVDVTVECSEQDSVLTVAVELSDNGPGTYSDSEGNTGSFGAFDSFAYELDTTPSSLTVNVQWFTEESGSFTTDIDECQPPPTTTTVPPTTTIPPTTTTVPATTTTVPGATTSRTVPPVSTLVSSPPTSPPAAELPATGSALLALALIGTSGAGLGLLLVAANRRANRKAGI